MNTPTDNHESDSILGDRRHHRVVRNVTRVVAPSPRHDSQFSLSDEQLDRYREGRLDPASAEALERRLADDPEACRRLARLAGVHDPTVPAELRDRFLAATPPAPRRRLTYRIAASLLIAAGTAVLLASARPTGLATLAPPTSATGTGDPQLMRSSTTLGGAESISGDAWQTIAIDVRLAPLQPDEVRHEVYRVRAAGLFAERRDGVEARRPSDVRAAPLPRPSADPATVTLSGTIEEFADSEPGRYEVLLIAATGRAPRYWLLPKIGTNARAVQSVRITVDGPPPN